MSKESDNSGIGRIKKHFCAGSQSVLFRRVAICRAKEGQIESCREDPPTPHTDEREA